MPTDTIVHVETDDVRDGVQFSDGPAAQSQTGRHRAVRTATTLFAVANSEGHHQTYSIQQVVGVLEGAPRLGLALRSVELRQVLAREVPFQSIG